MIKEDGLDRVASLNTSEIRLYQFLPLYDMLHLGTSSAAARRRRRAR